MKNALTIIHERTSVRAYTEQAVSVEQIETMLRAAMAAPSSKNKQPWHFVIITKSETLKLLAAKLPYAKMLEHAPLAIVVCGDTTVHVGEAENNWIMDCSAASENLLLAAQAIGLGAVWTGVFPYSERIAALREIAALPENIVPLNVIAIGYPRKEGHAREAWNPQCIHYEKF